MDDYNTILESARLVDSMPALIDVVDKLGNSLDSRRELADQLPDSFFKAYRKQVDAMISEDWKAECLDETDLSIASYFFSISDALLHHGPISEMVFQGVTFMLWYKSYQDDMSFEEAIHGSYMAWKACNDGILADLIKKNKTIH
jgi:hypothetical protein